MISACYYNYDGEKMFPEKSSFTTRGFDVEVNSWGCRKYKGEEPVIFSLYMVEPSPYHPAVMGKIDVYEGGQCCYVNPFFDEEQKKKIEEKLVSNALVQYTK